MKVREVNQLVAALSPGDAVGNEAMAFQRLLRDRGLASEIFAGSFSPDLADRGVAPLRI